MPHTSTQERPGEVHRDQNMTLIKGKGWKNGGDFPAGNSGYGIKIGIIDRHKFPRGTVELRLAVC
jgi:hypothetical protein